MTEREAIKTICSTSIMVLDGNPSKYDFARHKAISALKKQIPKKPTYDGDGYAPDGTFVWDEWLCPHCNSRYEVDFDEYDYCPNCGQALDWTEE